MDTLQYMPMFSAEAREHLQELGLAVVRLEERPDDPAALDEVFRIAHSFKSMSATMGFAPLASLAHKMEDVLELLRRRRGGLSREAIDVLLACLDELSEAVDALGSGAHDRPVAKGLLARLESLVRREERPRSAATVRVQPGRIDAVTELAEDLLARAERVAGAADRAGVAALADDARALERGLAELSASVTQLRLVPVEPLLMRLPRLVRDLSAQLGKDVELQLSGVETELDRTVVEGLADPLVMLARNALDHGIECPEERRAAGKAATGVLRVSARQAPGEAVIEVRDDGRGIDVGRVAVAAANLGLVEEGDDVDAARATELLFAPGLSTAERTSDISGRGVGMDAVREAVRGLGGHVAVSSGPGQGTSVSIHVPQAAPPERTRLAPVEPEIAA